MVRLSVNRRGLPNLFDMEDQYSHVVDTASQVAPRIFLNFRREDSSGSFFAMLSELRKHFGTDAIVTDPDDIPPGVDPRPFIRRSLDSCAVLLVIINRD